jgi:spermidine synthase/MFS family permease
VRETLYNLKRIGAEEETSRVGWYFAFFFISGFCSILYELVWLRLAMAQFGVTTALVSIVLSVFMAGLGGGSWVAGVLARRYADRISFPPLRLYALAELLIGCSSLAVPAQLLWGHRLVHSLTDQTTLSSATHYFASGILLALIVMPWCACMGATIPLAMSAIRSDPLYETRRSFSFLYLSNVIGAVAGAIVPLLLIELYGFHATLRVGALLNTAIAASAFGLTLRQQGRTSAPARPRSEAALKSIEPGKGTLGLLFLTGLATMGMEVVWIRLFTPYVGPFVYSFSFILACYLIATFAGSTVYRKMSRSRDPDSPLAWIMLAFLGLLPLITSDFRLHLDSLARVFLGVAPFAGLIGFLTPMLVDRWSAGNPDRAGKAYAVNILGCILGPLLSGFVLLPFVGECGSMLVLVLPWFAMAVPLFRRRELAIGLRTSASVILGATILAFFLTRGYETQFAHRVVLRDSTATVIATGAGMDKMLITNGVGMTVLTPTTKMMAHLPLASLDHPPRSALIICFGMGTTYRSLISWGIPATAVELVPSVPRLFSYYHDDGAKILASPLSHLVIDDGRRYLERSTQKYDVITVDPPPPVEAASSSLLYSEDFYAVVKERLQPGGILAQWLPYGDSATLASVARALKNSFPYVRVYRSFGDYGWHFLASMTSIPNRSAAELVARMPGGAVADMMEWGPARTPNQQFQSILSSELTVDQLIDLSPATPAMQDDRPINEYCLLRRLTWRLLLSHMHLLSPSS